ncbi:hypothetical protein [Proteiniclasticum sediminis]|nr:hypothetical protein [Proteiniclasticum sediminis]
MLRVKLFIIYSQEAKAAMEKLGLARYDLDGALREECPEMGKGRFMLLVQVGNQEYVVLVSVNHHLVEVVQVMAKAKEA